MRDGPLTVCCRPSLALFRPRSQSYLIRTQCVVLLGFRLEQCPPSPVAFWGRSKYDEGPARANIRIR
jgi:hypothetical protein